MTSRRQALLATAMTLGAMAALKPLRAQAQSQAAGAAWPTRPVRLVVGFPGGSSPDITARTLAGPLAQALGQPVVVENRVGAAGNIATDLVAKATDDHTLGLVINGNLTSSKLLYPSLPYDPAKDFSYLSILTTAPYVLVASNELPEGKAFIEAAKASGSRWNYGSVGVGSVAHLGMELLKSRLPGFEPQHVPYPGNPQVVTAILAGQLQLALVAVGVALPQAQAGKLRIIGLTSSGRSTLAPQVPSLAELGVRDAALEVWNGLVGPARLSAAAQARIGTEVARVMRDAQVRQTLFDKGWQPVGTSPEGMRRRVQEEAAIMGRIIQTRGIKLQ